MSGHDELRSLVPSDGEIVTWYETLLLILGLAAFVLLGPFLLEMIDRRIEP